MNDNLALDFHNPSVVRRAGFAALKKELGVVGTTYFLRQFDFGRGNYTEERSEWLDGQTNEDITEGIRRMKEANRNKD
ncbi:MAG: hypothetical protein LBG12_12845 [Synergistaceae bacterium]|jgi:hypothetical protein|nr:hypothetical protein [Synergistaceae bacterium]